MPEAKGDSHPMKKTTPKQPDTQTTPPAQPAEAVQQTGEEEKPVAANSAAALRERLLGTLAKTRQVVAGVQERHMAKQRAEEERQSQEERARKMGAFGDLKTQKRAAEERLQPILRAHSEARATLEAANAEMQDKKALLAELKGQMQGITPPEGIIDEDAVAAITHLEETVGVLRSAIEYDEGTVVPTAQQQVDVVYAEKVDAEKEVAQTAHGLKTPEFEGLEAEYNEAFQQYQALEAKVDELAGQYAELDRKLKAFAKEAFSTARTPDGHQKTNQFEERFQQLQDDAETLLDSVIEAGIILDADNTANLHPSLMAVRLVCKNFKIGTDGKEDAFQAAEGLLSQINKGEETSMKANEALFELQAEAFKRKHGVEAHGMYPKNLFRLEKLRGTKPTGEILGYGFSSVKAGKEEIADEDLLLAPGVSIREVNGRNVNFVSVREEQEKRTKRRTTEGREPKKPGTKSAAERKEVPKAGIPGILAKLRSSVKSGEVAPTKQLKDRTDAFLLENREEVELKKGSEDVKVSVPAKGVYRIFAMDGKTKVAIGVALFKPNKSGQVVLSKVATLGGFDTDFRTYIEKKGFLNDVRAGKVNDLLVDLHEQAVKHETTKLNPKPKTEGEATKEEGAVKAAPTVTKGPNKPGSSLRDLHLALTAPVDAGSKSLAERMTEACDARIAGDITTSVVKKEGTQTGVTEITKYSCPGWHVIKKDGFTLGVAKLETEGEKVTVKEVVTDPQYQTAVETFVGTMVKAGNIQKAGSEQPLQEGLVPVGQNRLKKLYKATHKQEEAKA